MRPRTALALTVCLSVVLALWAFAGDRSVVRSEVKAPELVVIGEDIPHGAVFWRIEDRDNDVVCYSTGYRNSRYGAPEIACVKVVQ